LNSGRAFGSTTTLRCGACLLEKINTACAMAASLEKESTPHQHFSDDDDTSDEDPGSSCKMTVKLLERCREILASGTCWRSWYVLVMFSHEADVNSTSHRGP